MDIDSLGPQLAGQILNALLSDRTPISASVPRDTMIAFIVEHVGEVDLQCRYSIGDIIIHHGRASDIRECGEGSVIDLDRLSDEIITDIYELLMRSSRE